MKKRSLVGALAFATAMTAGAGTSLGVEPQSASSNGQDSHAEISLQNNMNFGSLRADGGRAGFVFDYDAGTDRKFELTATAERKITPVLSAFAGTRAHYKGEPDQDGTRAVAGVRAALPLGIDFDATIDHKGHKLLELSGEPHLTNRLSVEWRANTERELRANVNYGITKHIAVTAGYDTSHGKGVGVKFSS
jgi:hypothetical protein